VNISTASRGVVRPARRIGDEGSRSRWRHGRARRGTAEQSL